MKVIPYIAECKCPSVKRRSEFQNEWESWNAFIPLGQVEYSFIGVKSIQLKNNICFIFYLFIYFFNFISEYEYCSF